MMYGVPLLVFNAWITLVTYLQVNASVLCLPGCLAVYVFDRAFVPQKVGLPACLRPSN